MVRRVGWQGVPEVLLLREGEEVHIWSLEPGAVRPDRYPSGITDLVADEDGRVLVLVDGERLADAGQLPPPITGVTAPRRPRERP